MATTNAVAENLTDIFPRPANHLHPAAEHPQLTNHRLHWTAAHTAVAQATKFLSTADFIHLGNDQGAFKQGSVQVSDCLFGLN